MDYNYITPGELAPGQYVTILSFKPQQKEVLLPNGEVRTITEEDKSPWIKGLPYRVLNVKLPLVMLHNVCEVPNIPPATFFDTRLVEFLEVDADYAYTYKFAMYPPEKQREIVGPEPEPEPTDEEPNGQKVFNFEDDDKGEDGPPPLIPV